MPGPRLLSDEPLGRLLSEPLLPSDEPDDSPVPSWLCRLPVPSGEALSLLLPGTALEPSLVDPELLPLSGERLVSLVLLEPPRLVSGLLPLDCASAVPASVSGTATTAALSQLDQVRFI